MKNYSARIIDWRKHKTILGHRSEVTDPLDHAGSAFLERPSKRSREGAILGKVSIGNKARYAVAVFAYEARNAGSNDGERIAIAAASANSSSFRNVPSAGLAARHAS